MFQGQRKHPKYKVGDTVHLIDPTDQQSARINNPATTNLPVSGKPAHRTSSSSPSALRQSTQTDTSKGPTSNISKSTAYRVTALHTASTDQESHQYELSPLEPLKITATESSMVPAPFLPGDIVTPISSAAELEEYYRIEAITIKEDAPPLTSKLGYCAKSGRAARDDGEYDLLENPFAGGFHATRKREVAGTNFGGTQRTSLGRAAVEERVRVVLSLVDGCGIRVQMDAGKVRKVSEEEEWKFVKLEKFMGQT